jgi:hypothetical protein
VNFTATVSPVPPATGTPGGTVQFKINGADFGTPVALAGGSAASLTTSTLAVGNHTVSAIYSGDNSFNGSTSVSIIQTVIALNRPPVLTPIGNKTVNEGQLLSFAISATDPDGDVLTYSYDNLPTGASFDLTTRTFSWTPTYDQAGTYPDIKFSVTDGKATPVSESIIITVVNVNRPPVIQSVAAEPSQLWPPNKKPVNVKFVVVATDPDGANDIVRTTYSVSDEYGQYNVPETTLPVSGTISLVPDRDGNDKDGRIYTITIKVYDAGGLSAARTANVICPHDQATNK